MEKGAQASLILFYGHQKVLNFNSENGDTTLSIMALTIMTLSIMTFTIMTQSIMILSMITLSNDMTCHTL